MIYMSLVLIMLLVVAAPSACPHIEKNACASSGARC